MLSPRGTRRSDRPAAAHEHQVNIPRCVYEGARRLCVEDFRMHPYIAIVRGEGPDLFRHLGPCT